MLKRFLNDNSGATALVFAIAMPVFVGGIILAVEMGNWHQNKSQLQEMADITAVAAAQEIMLLGDDGDYEYAGKGHAFENGFNFNTGDVVVTNPPTSGKYAGKTNMVEVELNRLQKMYFAQYFGNKSFDINTRAIAAVVEGVPACILALNPTRSGAIGTGGSADVTLNGCGVHANSNSDYAIQVTDMTASCIGSAGGIQTSNQTQITECDGAEPYSRTLRDPYSDVKVPDTLPACNTSGGNKINKNLKEVYPGRYCNKSVTFGRTIHFKDPGVYYFDGVDLGISSSHSLIYGRGVTIVFMNGGTFNGVTGGTVDLTAPNATQVSGTEANFAGMSIYFDPDTTPSGTHVKINGNSSSQIEGVIYAPTVDLQMNGTGNASSKCTQIIASTIDFRGNASFTNQNCEAIGARQIGGLTGIALVE